jgi:hypothetical protein
MRTTLHRGGIASLAGALGVGLFLLLPGSANASSEPAVTKRDETAGVLVTAADDDDDDDSADSRSRVTRSETSASLVSRVSRDATNSRVTRASRDRDISVSDRTRDWTMDGGDRTRDRSADSTNDRSRHDTRARG